MNKPPCMVWLPMDHRLLGEPPHQAPFLVLGEKYARAVKVCAQAQPVLFPLADAQSIPALLSLVDGVMLTGSPSNIHPAHFDEDLEDQQLPLDPARDTLTLALVKACLAQQIPLLGICRGFQEINVALGGTLHQRVQLLHGHLDHRAPHDEPLNLQYAPRHEIFFKKDSVFATWAGTDSVRVNSLHGQGIAKLAPGLTALGRATDGLVEAFCVEDAANFAYAVQWHPEWRCWDSPFSARLFGAFGNACRTRQALRYADSQEAQKYL